jgi:hydrogenase nickel incorporation protein HypA/HybF
MHEMALAEGILSVALEAAQEQRVRRIQLQAGVLQHVTANSLQFCFQLVAADTPAAEAVVEIAELPVELRCTRCATETVLRTPPFQCRQCGAFDVEVVSGEQVLVDAIELEDGWVRRPGGAAAQATVEVSAEHLREHALAETHAHASDSPASAGQRGDA